MNRAELKEKIEKGSDVLFDIKDKHFTLITWVEEGIGIDESNSLKNNMQFFKTADDLLNAFLIDGKCLGDLAADVVITDYTGNGIE
nr:MAG TPA: hypothetical protein [Bacteriophage sp.]